MGNINGPTIDIGLFADVDKLINSISSKLSNAKTLGLDKAAANDIKNIESMVDDLKRGISDISHTKVNTSSFAKAQKEIIDRVTLLEERTSALEQNLTSLVTTLSKADGSNLSQVLQGLVTDMNALSTATKNTMNEIGSAVSTGSKKELSKLSDALESVINAAEQTPKVTNFKKIETAIEGILKAYDEYFEVKTKIDDLQDSGINTVEDQKQLAALQKELIVLGNTFNTIIDKSAQKFGPDIYSKSLGAGMTFESMSLNIERTMEEIVRNVSVQRKNVENEIQQMTSTLSKSGDERDTHEVEVKVVTTKKGLTTQLRELLDSVKPYLDENPVEVPISFKTDWGTKQSNKLLKDFQSKIDALAADTDVSELNGLLDEVRKSFSNELGLRFTSNFDKERKAITTGLSALRREVKTKFDINPNIELTESAATKTQKQLDKISKQLVLSIGKIELSETASEKINKTIQKKLGTNTSEAEALEKVIDLVISKIDDAEKSLAPIVKVLWSIRGILEEYPINEIIDSTKELVSLFQQTFGIVSSTDLDGMFDTIAKDVQNITGSLRGNNLKAVKDVLAAFNEYKNLGGTKSLSDLGGAENVQKWLKKNYTDIEGVNQTVIQGQNFAKDYSAGIKKGIPDVEQAARELADAALNALISEQNSNSPQKASEQLGKEIAKSAQAAGKESKAIQNVSSEAQTAAESKKAFAQANKEVLDSIVTSLNGLKNEGKAFENLNRLISNLSGEKGSAKLQSTTEGLKAIVEALSTDISDNSLLDVLQKIATSGSNLSDIATILKASNKDLLDAKKIFNGIGQDTLDDLLKNHSQDIAKRAKQELSTLGGDGSQVLNISEMQKTKDGFIEIVGLVRTADNALQEFTLHTKDGFHMQNVGMSENTARIAKQMKVYAQAQQFFERMQAQGKNVTDGEFFDKNTDPETWQMLVNYAREYHEELGNILNITTQVRQASNGELLKSFSLNGENGHLTVGVEGETVAYNQQLLDVQKLADRIKTLSGRTKEYHDLVHKVGTEGWTSADATALKEIEDEYSDIVRLVKEYSDVLGDSTNITEIFSSALNKMTVNFNNKEQSYIDKVSKVLLDAQNNPLSKSTEFTSSFRQDLDAAISKVSELQALINQHGNTNAPWSEDELEQLRELHNNIDSTVLSVKDLTNVLAKSTSIDKLLAKINKDLHDQSAMPKELKAQFIALRDEIDTARNSLDGLNKVDYSELERKFQSLHEQVTRINPGIGIIEQISKAAKTQTVQFLARYFSLQDIIRYTRELAQNVVNIDSAITELRKVSDASNTRLAQSFEKSAATAQELGQTIQHVINVTADWARLGYDVDQAEELARVTALFTSVGDNMSADDASSYLISTLQGFQLGTDQAEEIVDKYNQVANNFAIDTAGIGQALQRSAASFNAANTDLSKAIALITATNEVVQNPESVGTLWKTMSARIRGATTELEDLGEEEDEFTKTTSKLRDLVKSLTGFDIMKDEETFKDIYEIILGIGREWDKLTDVERASLGEALAGKRNSNALYAVLGNLDTLQEAYQAAEDSAGSAAREQENYAQSVQYSIDRFKASIEELSYDFLNSQLLKQGVEFANSLIKVLDSIVEHTNLVVDVFAVLATIIAVKNAKAIKSFAKIAIANLADIGAAVKLSQGAFLGMSDTMAGLQFMLLNYAPIIAGIVAVTAVVTAAAIAWDEWQTTVEEYNKKISDTTDRIGELRSEIEKLRDIDFRTQEQQNRLDLLESELKYQERLLEVETQRQNIQKYGYSSFAQAWDKDNANNVLTDDTHMRGYTGLGIGDSRFIGMGFDAGTVAKAASDIAGYNDKLKQLDESSDDYAKTLEKRNKVEEETADNLESLYTQTADYENKLQEAQKAQEGFAQGSDAYKNAQHIIDTYSSWIDENKSAIEAYEKVLGIFDYSSTIDSMFQHTEYEKLKEELLEIAKAGELTKEVLESNDDPLIKALIEDLQAAGIEVEGLYQYLLKLAGLVDRQNLVDKINNKILHGSGVVGVSGSEYDKSILASYINGLSEEDAKIVAGLDIDWSTFNAQEAIDKMQAEIKKAGPVEAEIKVNDLSFTQSISDLNDLENALNNVGTAMANIDENGKFQLGDLDNIADYFLGLEAAEEKVEYETDAVANALKLLGEGTGDLQQNADAINTIADNYLRTSGILDGLTEKNKELYVTRLQMMGIINAETIVEEQLANIMAQDADATLINTIATEQLAHMKDALQAEDSETVAQISEVINALLDESDANDTTRRAVEYLIQVQGIFSNQDLDVNSKIEQLEKLASAYIGTAEAAKLAAQVEALESQKDLIKGVGVTPEIKAAEVAKIDSQIQSLINASAAKTTNTKVTYTRAQYNGGTPVSSKLGYTPSSTADALQGTQAKAIEDAASKAADAAKEAEDSFEQLYDYFERMIKVLDNSIDLLEAHLQDVVGSFAKNTLLSAEENVIRSKMNGYASAIDMYSQKAAEALSKIPSDVAARLQNGAVAIEEFVGEGNEEVYEAIQDYEQWADKVANCKQQIVELREALRQLELQKFNNVAQDFQELFDVRQTQIDLISKAIELFDTARDKIVGRGFYDEAIEQKEKQLSKLFEKRVALNEQMASAMANGVETAGDEWFEMLDAVEEVNSEILEAQKSIEEYKNAIIQLYVDAFDRESDRYTKQIALRQKAIDALEKQISVISSAGNVAGRAYYDEQIKQTAKQIVMLEEERRELESRLNDAIKNGVKVGTSEWYAMVDAINEVDSAIQDANKSIEDYKNSIVQLYMELFNRETDRYSKQVSLRQKSVEALEKQITAIEASGNVVGESFFKEQIEQTEKQIDMLEKERKALMQKMSDATANGVKVGSDEWYEMVDALNNVDSAIQECVASIEEMDNAILELHTETFERIQNRYSSLSSEMSNMADMLSDKDVATADNVWTKEGLSQLGLYAQQYELAKKQVSQFNQEIDELNKQYANGKYSVTEYTTKLAELKEQQWASVKSAKAAKESIIELNKARVDIVVEGIQKEIEAYKELIEAQKDALSSEKELRDYEKSIAESSKSISDLERQLAAMANDDSAAARAKRLKLEAELEEAREDLADKEYEHSISVQQEALAQQAEDFQAARELEIEALQETLEQEKSLLIESFNAVKENAALIAEELILMAQNLNITMSPEITAPWQAGEAAIAAYSELFNVESSAFMTRLGEVEASEWRVQEQANNSSQAISDMFGNRSDELVEQTNVANDTFRAEEEAVLNASAAIAENFSKRADELVSSTDEANAAFRAEEQAAWDASGAIANAFGNRADELVATIENARGSTENLTAMSDALADSLANSIDGSYSGSSATSALGSIADAANDVAEAANNAADALRNMIDAQSSVENNQPKEHVTSIYGGEHAGQVAVWSDRNGNYSFRANGSKRISHDELAWTQEKGSEIIISPSSGAILTPLKAGDAVIPADMTSNLWAWGSFNPQEFAAKLLENSNMNTSGNVQANTMQIGSLITVNGNINDTEEMVMIASNQAANKIKQSFKELSNNLRD